MQRYVKDVLQWTIVAALSARGQCFSVRLRQNIENEHPRHLVTTTRAESRISESYPTPTRAIQPPFNARRPGCAVSEVVVAKRVVKAAVQSRVLTCAFRDEKLLEFSKISLRVGENRQCCLATPAPRAVQQWCTAE